MNTQPTEKERQSSGWIAGSPTPPTPVQQGQVLPPLPPQRPVRSKYRGWYIGFAIVIVLLLLLSIGVFAFSQYGPGQRGTQPKPTTPPSTVQPTFPAATVTPGGDKTPTPAAGVVLGPQACPAGIGDPAHWNAIIGTSNGERSVEYISCANIMGNPSLQALVLVRHNNVNRTLDVYVFDHITSANPTRIFLLQGLLKGDAKISGYNTVLTAEVDKNSSINAGKPVSAVDLFREFKWTQRSVGFEQVAFPGIFPDLTRYQGEQDQREVNAGKDSWKNDPAQVAKALAAKYLDWKQPVTTKVISGGRAQDVNARIQVQETAPQGASFSPYVMVTLSRLEGNTHNMWVAISADGASMLTLNNINDGSVITSPVTLKGFGSAFEAVIGKAVIYDHLSTDIGHAQVTGNKGMGQAEYSTDVSYTSSYQQGVQEGLVAVYEANGGMSSESATAVLRKVLINPGTPSGPAGISNPSYWTPFISTPPNIMVAESVTFANLLDRSS